jgi:DNA-binding beta-propeller fold protein YncE
MRPGFLVLAAVLVAAGCSAQAPPPEPPRGFVFYEAEHGIAVADGRGTVLSAGATVASADWSTLYAVRGSELVALDPGTNRTLATSPVPSGFRATVVSVNGNLVALTESSRTKADRPVGKLTTRIVVADPAGKRPARELTLDGNFEPEAFSAGEDFLYVLEYLPANAPERYRVRRVELASGAVQPLLLRDKRVVPAGAEEEMRGEGRQAVLAPDHTRLYTLYLHQGDHQHTRDLLAGRHAPDGRPVHAFVHVLSLTEGWAYCLDLPDPFGLHPAGTHALTISPDGRALYVTETETGQIAVADTESLAITRVAPVPGGPSAAGDAFLSFAPAGDALYLSAGNLVRRLDSTTLRVDATWPQPAPVRGLAVSPDGRQVLIGQRDHIVRIDAGSGQAAGTVAAAGLARLVRAVR